MTTDWTLARSCGDAPGRATCVQIPVVRSSFHMSPSDGRWSMLLLTSAYMPP